MPNDEHLREALLELQVLRDREKKNLEATQNLLTCLEAYSQASDPRDALHSVFSSLQDKTGCTDCIIVTPYDDQKVTILASTNPAQFGTVLDSPIDLFRRKRNITNLSLLGQWGDAVTASDYNAMMIWPVKSDMSVVCLKSGRNPFSKSDSDLLSRLAGLATQAYQNLQLAREKDLLSAAIAGSSSGIAIADATDDRMPLVYVNTAFEEISGYPAAEVLGNNCRFLSAEPKDSPERIRLRNTINARGKGTFVLRNLRKSGEAFWNELTLFPVIGTMGKVSHIVATQSDVSQRIETSQALDSARMRMEQALAATEDAFLVLNADGTVALSNTAVENMFPAAPISWQPGTTFAENWTNYITYAQQFQGHVTSLIKDADLSVLAHVDGGQELELPDGQTVIVQAANLQDGGVVVSATDVTPMKSAQRLLAQRLTAIEAAPDGIAVTDGDGRITYLNSAAVSLMGYPSSNQALGRIWWQKYRSDVPLNTAASFDAHVAELTDPELRYHEITSSPLENNGFVISIRDVTEKLVTEAREEELTKDLMRLQRQEAVAQITAGIAHDFNNYLAAINGSATLIELQDDLPDDIRPHLKRIASAGAQSARLVNQLLDIGADASGQTSFDLTSVLADFPQLIDPLLPPQALFEIQQDDAIPALKGDPSDLTQVLVNLVLNAGHAVSANGGQVILHVTSDHAPAPDNIHVGDVRPNAHYAQITVSDSGHGMAPDVLEQIFQPYFTTKGHQGTGLGMAMVAAQTKSVGGAIAVESQRDLGTKIRLFWPLASFAATTLDDTKQGSVDLSGRMILVVDDDAHVGEVISKFLESKGAEVATCQDPLDALDAIQEDPDVWDALITDYDMPSMNGGELTQKTRTAAPDLPIFVVTALARRLSDPRLAQSQVAAILSKPVDMDVLSNAIAQASDPKLKE